MLVLGVAAWAGTERATSVYASDSACSLGTRQETRATPSSTGTALAMIVSLHLRRGVGRTTRRCREKRSSGCAAPAAAGSAPRLERGCVKEREGDRLDLVGVAAQAERVLHTRLEDGLRASRRSQPGEEGQALAQRHRRAAAGRLRDVQRATARSVRRGGRRGGSWRAAASLSHRLCGRRRLASVGRGVHARRPNTGRGNVHLSNGRTRALHARGSHAIM